jgi:hypothetical protein
LDEDKKKLANNAAGLKLKMQALTQPNWKASSKITRWNSWNLFRIYFSA